MKSEKVHYEKLFANNFNEGDEEKLVKVLKWLFFYPMSS